MTRLVILTVRNEGAFLIDWLAHHRAVGFDRFLVFSNDCQDGTDAMLDRLEETGWLTHVRNDDHGPRGPQWAALNTAARHPLVRGADWILVADIDEFVNVHAGDRTLDALFAALPQADAIALTWRMFGNGGVVALADTPVPHQFTRSAPAVLEWPWRAQLIKTLYRNDGRYPRPGVHRPRGLAEAADPPAWFDGSGRRLPPDFARTGMFTPMGRDAGALVQLNHYALGSMEGYLVKCDRGRANRDGSAFDAGYWIERNFDAVEDRSILAIEPRVAPIRAALRADPALDGLHRAAFDWRRARFRALMTEEPWRDLFGRLMLAPPSRLLTAAQARLIWLHPRRAPVPKA